ncbi:MAG: D-glycero-beta-D-manno-heptose 1-phosphate adenylyltransferase [Chroococcidiopsidaceae cyanobacterium CP_BM_RX_35]|nr:D-glycero-beta-D-manno-heptose 1-phosphate adenylyltransferase [Chroococcidiopsidaceae cyanobacterium CP_BM_RX_35]
MLDCYLTGFSDRLCPEAPVPVVTVTDQRHTAGGAANTAVNLHSLGAKVTFLSAIGDDWEGAILRQVLQAQGISHQHILTHPSRRTLTKQRIIAASQMLVRFDQGSTTLVEPEIERTLIDELDRSFLECNAVIVSDYGYGVMTTQVIQALAKLQQSQPRILVVDSKNLTAYRDVGVTAVKPNYEQAVKLLNIPIASPTERVDQIVAHQEQLLDLTRARIAAVTLDVEGALIFERDRVPYRTYARKTLSYHVTGAGDTFTSALTLALAAGATTPTAADFAASSAAIVVEKAGTTGCSTKELRKSLFSPPVEKCVFDSSSLVTRVAAYRDCGYRIVFTNGCFDILHTGHVSYLQRAKALGDILVIGVNSDASVSRLKGPSRPINSLEDRIQVLAALGCVDLLVAFDEDTPSKLIQLVRPEVYVKGGDYTKQTLPEALLVERLGGVVQILPFVENRSTTSIIARIAGEKA